LLVRSVTKVNKSLLDDSSVRFVGTATSGFDHIDKDYLDRCGIAFAHAPGANANSVVEYVLTAIAASGDKLEQLLSGGSLGIVGYGNIGKALAGRFRALGIVNRVYDPWLEENSFDCAADLSSVLSCDVITLHAELTLAQPWPSHYLLGQKELGSIAPDALLINTCRGSVVDNSALLALLESGGGPHTILDVWEGEPAINAALVARVELGTAHIAGYSLDGKLLATRILRDALAAFLNYSLPSSQSNAKAPPSLALTETHTAAGLIRYLLQARYDIDRDHALLCAAVQDRTASSKGEAFDGLRKGYRERRELAGTFVQGSPQIAGHDRLVRALGCIPEFECTVP
jgi:erythronate-4-phosphate dehydrogenase